MHWKDVVLTAHQHIHVRSPLAQDSSGLKIIHSEKLKWKWVCSAVLLISGFEKKKMKSCPKGSEMTMKPKEDGKKTAWVWDFLTVKDCTFSKSLNVENNNNH